jgi:hypothetical protein
LAVRRHANISSQSDMTKVVMMLFQQIMTEHSGAKIEEDKIMSITKTIFETHVAKWPLAFRGASKL